MSASTLGTADRPAASPAPPDPVSTDAGPGPRSGRERLALGLLLAGTGVLYLWNLSASGWANSFYAAAVQAGTQSWTAFFFGSLDAGNAITVDKPPASLWPMEIASRIFGFSSWSLLVPQALMGVAAVALLYAAVRRVAGPGAGLLAGAVLALTPVATLMFRFDNPDALLTLLMVAAAYTTTRAVQTERRGAWWLVATGLLIGFAFLAKSLQAFLVVPGLALVYLWAAPGSVRRRVLHVLGGGAGIVVGAGWWLLAVALWPVAQRPYIGGSGDNTPLGLAFGYNGLSRILGGEGGPGGGVRIERGTVAGQAGGLPGGYPGTGTSAGGFPGGGMPPGGGGPGGGMFGGAAGPLRMFTESFATQVSWLLPAALALLVVALWITRRAPRTDRVRSGLLLWGGWTLVTIAVFSFMSGIIHPYYTVALAPGIAALVGIGGTVVLRRRGTWVGRVTLAVVTAGTSVWAWVLLGWSPEFLPWLRWVVLVVGVLAGIAFLLPSGRRRWVAAVVGAAVLAGVGAPAASAVQTAAVPRTGSIPVAGPSVEGADGGPGGMRYRVRDGRADGAGQTGPDATNQATGQPGQGGPGQGGPGQGGSGPGQGGPGEERTGAALVALLRSAGTTRWAAATVGSQGAASMELASGASVMAIGGFSGSDEYPTVEQFQGYVRDGQIRYLVAGNGAGPGRERGVGTQITEWVAAHYAATTVDDRTVYDLSAPIR